MMDETTLFGINAIFLLLIGTAVIPPLLICLYLRFSPDSWLYGPDIPETSQVEQVIVPPKNQETPKQETPKKDRFEVLDFT